MDKESGKGESDQIETISAAAGGQQQVQIKIDDTHATLTYSSTVRVWGTAEEINLDFAGPLRPTGPKGVVDLKIDHRVVLSPWGAKRLCLALHQAIARYEQTYGKLEVDPRKRMINPPPTAPNQPSKLS